MEDEESKSNQMTVTKLILAADHYATVCPAIARHYMDQAEEMKLKIGTAASPRTQICEFCKTIWRPGNHRILLIPRMQLTKSIRKILKHQKSGDKIGKLKERLLSLYLDGRNRQVIICSVCKKRTKILAAVRPSTQAITKETGKQQKIRNKSSRNHKDLAKSAKKKGNSERSAKQILGAKKSLIDGFREKFGLQPLKKK